jgi:hypothetical protein
MDVKYGPTVVVGYTPDHLGSAITQVIEALGEALEEEENYGRSQTQVRITIEIVG